MGHIADIIVTGACRTRGYAERLLKDVQPGQFARLPRFETAGKPAIIQTNHPAWAYGHLATYPSRVLESVGLKGSHIVAPAGFEDLFKDGTACQDDAKGTIYPAMAAITAHYFKAYDAAIEAIAGLDDAKLSAQTPDEKARVNFPIIGGRVNFMLNNHVMMHMGQVSAWRRCMGLPPA